MMSATAGGTPGQDTSAKASQGAPRSWKLQNEELGGKGKEKAFQGEASADAKAGGCKGAKCTQREEV